jgi:acyl-CoA thioesterase I
MGRPLVRRGRVRGTPARWARLGVAALLAVVAVGVPSAGHAHARAPSAVHSPSGEPLRLSVLGDSLAAGFDASSRERAWPELVRAGLSEGGAVSLVVDGRPGWTAVQAAAAHVPTPPADVVVVEYGTNDVVVHSAPRAFTTAYRTLLDRVRRASPRAALVCTGPWVDPARAAVVERAVSSACEQRGGVPVPLSGLFTRGPLHALRGSRYFGGEVPNDFHPDDEGHARIAAAVLGALAHSPGRPGAHLPRQVQAA